MVFGNKMRFINDQDERQANIAARVVLCNMVTRIGMFAKRDIPIGDELFFDYGYVAHLSSLSSTINAFSASAFASGSISSSATMLARLLSRSARNSRATLSKAKPSSS